MSLAIISTESNKVVMLREMEDNAVTDISTNYFQTAYKQPAEVISICIVCVTLLVLCLYCVNISSPGLLLGLPLQFRL